MTSGPPTGGVVQVNVSPGGVPKLPVAEARVGRNGLDGDAHDHDAVHGGPHRAVCLFASEAMERVRADGHPGVGPGSVGENLTTAGIELSLLDVGTRLAIGGEVVLEISGPANPCDVIKGAFSGGKSGRISILLHPSDSRMYARVEREGIVRPGDSIGVLPARPETAAAVHRELDLLDSVERDAWTAMWRAAAAAGIDVRILERGDFAAAASPDLPGSVFNRAFGMRQVPIHRPTMEAHFRAAGTPGWLVVAADDQAFAGRELEWPVGVHVAPIEEVLGRIEGGAAPAADGLEIRRVDPDDVDDVARWADLFIAGFGIEGPLADAWRQFNPFLVRSRGYHQFIGSLDGRDIAASALFNRRRVAWLGAGTVLPAARGRGIQRALIIDRVQHALEAGSTRVMATAEIDTVSAANLERLGIHRIWTRGHARVDPVATHESPGR
ncbi:MAG TPA: MOSC domain-containing protein [Candidatus Limnocylindrales bacterium]|nr:MOSC domain-containing protein [Candidatus Limnocylindrales bacterium]